jgi:tetratricopeptide (TPR) repeat protein
MTFAALLTLLVGMASAVLAAQAQPPVSQKTSPITFNRDLAPVVFEHCASCHRTGGVGPFPLESYADLRARARQVVNVVRRREMPPWKPEDGFGRFEGDRRLSDEQIGLFEAWLEEGMAAGDPADLPARPQTSDGWQLGKPDLVLSLPTPFALGATGGDRIRNFVLPIAISERRFVRAWEFRTDSPQVVHHATMMLDTAGAARALDGEDPAPGYEGLIPLSAQNPDGYFLGWTPGQTPSASPEHIAWRLDPGTDMVVMLHLRPSGRIEAVNVMIGLYFSDVPPSRTPVMIRLNRQDLDIPANQPRYAAVDTYTLPVAVDVYAVQPHAHNLARQVRASATLPDGRTEPLISIRDWDFHWQDLYRFAEPLRLPAGSVLEMEFVYDNSNANRANPNQPARRVTYGQGTSDEMGDVWLQVVPRDPNDLSTLTRSLRRKLLPQNIAGYRMLMAADPDNAGLHNDLAVLLIEAGDMPGAAVQFSEVLRLAPDRATAHYNLGNALLYLRRLTEAEEHFRRALALQTGYALAHQGLGLVLLATNRLDDAAAHLEEAVKLTQTADAHYNLAVVRQRQGRVGVAQREYSTALKIEPNHVAARIELTWILATSHDVTLRNPAEAVALSDALSAAASPLSARALDVRAAALAAAGRYDEAVVVALQAIALLAPTDAATRVAIDNRISLYKARRAFVEGPN